MHFHNGFRSLTYKNTWPTCDTFRKCNYSSGTRRAFPRGFPRTSEMGKFLNAVSLKTTPVRFISAWKNVFNKFKYSRKYFKIISFSYKSLDDNPLLYDTCIHHSKVLDTINQNIIPIQKQTLMTATFPCRNKKARIKYMKKWTNGSVENRERRT